MTQERRVDYEIRVQDSFSNNLDRFAGKITEVRALWAGLRGELQQSTGTTELAKDLKDVTSQRDKLRSLAQSMSRLRQEAARTQAATRGVAKNLRDTGTAARNTASGLTQASNRSRRFRRDVAAATQGMTGFTTSLRRAVAIMGRIFTVFIAFRAFQATISAIGASIRAAFDFNNTVNTARISIQGLLSALTDVRGVSGENLSLQEQFAATAGIATEQLRLLRAEALASSATFADLAFAFQTALGPGLSAGLDIDEVRTISVRIAQAATALGLSGRELTEEIRSLFTGVIRPANSRLASVLQITPDDIRRARETGELFGFLQERLEAFGVAGASALQLLSVQLVNFRDLLSQVGADTLDSAFERTGNAIAEITSLIGGVDSSGFLTINPEVAQVLEEVERSIDIILDGVEEIVRGFGVNGLQSAATAFRATIQAISPVLLTIGRTLSGIFIGITTSIEIIDAFVRALVRGFSDAEGAGSSVSAIFDSIGINIRDVAQILGTIVGPILAFRAASFAISGIWTLLAPVLARVRNIVVGLSIAIQAANLSTLAIVGGATVLLGLIAAVAAASGVFGDEIEDAVQRLEIGNVQVGRILQTLGILASAAGDTFANTFDALGTILEVSFSEGLRGAALLFFRVMTDGINIVLGTLARGLDSILGTSFETRITALTAGAQRAAASFLDAEKAAVGIDEALAEARRKQEQIRQNVAAQFRGLAAEISQDAARGATSLGDVFNAIATSSRTLIKDVLNLARQEAQDISDRSTQAILTTANRALTDFVQESQQRIERLQDSLNVSAATEGLTGFAADFARITGEQENLFRRAETSAQNAIGALDQELVLLADRLTNAKDYDILQDQITEKIVQQEALVNQLTEAESQLNQETSLRVQAAATSAAGQAALEQERLNIQLQGQKTISDLQARINSSTTDTALLQIQLQREQLDLQQRLADVTLRQQQRQLEAGQKEAEALGLSREAQEGISAVLDSVIQKRETLKQLTEEQLEANDALLAREQRRRDNPAGQAFQEVFEVDEADIFQSAVRVATAFRDGLSRNLAGAITNGLFSEEEDVKERFRKLAKSLAQTLLEEFLKTKVLSFLAQSGKGAGGSISPSSFGQLDFFNKGGSVGKKGTPSPAHFGPKAQFFNVGGRPKGVPASDTVAAWLTPKEYVHQVSAVKKYGLRAMEAINRGIIDPAALNALLTGTRLTPSMSRRGRVAYNTGGQVSASRNSSDSVSSGRGLTIVNAWDQQSVAAAMTSALGQQVILNTVANAQQERS